MSASAQTRDEIDGQTCRSICEAVGERLQQDLRPASSDLSPHLQALLNEFKRRDLAASPTDRSWA